MDRQQMHNNQWVSMDMWMYWNDPNWGLVCQEQVSKAGTGKYVPQYLYVSLPLMTAGTHVLNYRPTALWNCGATAYAVVAFVIINADTHL